MPLRHPAVRGGDPLGSGRHLAWLQAFIIAAQMELQRDYLEARLAPVSVVPAKSLRRNYVATRQIIQSRPRRQTSAASTQPPGTLSAQSADSGWPLRFLTNVPECVCVALRSFTEYNI